MSPAVWQRNHQPPRGRGQQEGRRRQTAQGLRIPSLQGIRRAHQQYAGLFGLPFDRDPHPVGLLGGEQIAGRPSDLAAPNSTV
jgi:hypothetical protein